LAPASPPALKLRSRYTRSDPKGLFPRLTGLPGLPANRLGAFWRPIIDLTDSDLAPSRLRMIRPVASWLEDPAAGQPLWFARINVTGLRRQVIRHSGLNAYECREPKDLPGELRTPAWETLVRAIDRFDRIDYYVRTLVLFQLAQLSYCELGVRLAGDVTPDGDPVRDRYVYQVARVHARLPGSRPYALELFERLATSSRDSLLALLASFQGISHAIRKENDLDLARRFERYGRAVTGLPDDWHTFLVQSRFHRALALLRLNERRFGEMRDEVTAALACHERLRPEVSGEIDTMVADENRRILLESQINAAIRARGDESAAQVRALCEEIIGLDPYCVLVRLAVGDGHAAIDDYEEAARWYERAGALGTGAGAIGWFRAGQCHDFLGDRGAAVNAYGRCLELDLTAVEPREYLTAHAARRGAA
jgi:tetratricopeptide (TPR) repeat protein